MKKLLMMAVAVAMSSAAMAMTLQAAKAQIPGAVANPAKMAEIMKELSEDDQIEFLCLVNAAIAEMSGSADEKAALYLQANEAALKAHGEGNLQALLAATYATVPPEALTVLNEQLAKDLFNRNADPTRPVSDAEFAALAKEAMETIATRASDTDDAAVRTTFALLMFVRASEGTPADLRQTLADTITDPDARSVALNEWIPAALGEGPVQTYDPMLGASDAETQVPSNDQVLTIAGSQDIVPLLGDLRSDNGEYLDATSPSVANPGLSDHTDTASAPGSTTPSPVEGSPWTEERGESEGYEPTPTPQPQPHPDPYSLQSIY